MFGIAAAIFFVVFVAVLLIAMCADHDQPPPPKPKVKQNPQMPLKPETEKPIFQTDLEEVSENVAFHVIEGGKPNLCFAMDNYYADDVPEPPPPPQEGEDWKTATYRSYALSSVRDTPTTVKKPDRSSSSYDYEYEESSYSTSA